MNIECPDCQGEGQLEVACGCWGKGVSYECGRCGNCGYVAAGQCQRCNGLGVLKDPVEIEAYKREKEDSLTEAE